MDLTHAVCHWRAQGKILLIFALSLSWNAAVTEHCYS